MTKRVVLNHFNIDAMPSTSIKNRFHFVNIGDIYRISKFLGDHWIIEIASPASCFKFVDILRILCFSCSFHCDISLYIILDSVTLHFCSSVFHIDESLKPGFSDIASAFKCLPRACILRCA